MIVDIINGFVNHIINNLDGFDSNNCKGFDNETVLDYIISKDLTPYPQQGVILSFGGVMEAKEIASEFGGMVTRWVVISNAFFPLSGDDDDEQQQIQNAYEFIDNLLLSVVQDSTLGNTCMDARLFDAEPPLEYKRNGVNTYLLISMRFVVLENIE